MEDPYRDSKCPRRRTARPPSAAAGSVRDFVELADGVLPPGGVHLRAAASAWYWIAVVWSLSSRHTTLCTPMRTA